MNLSNYQLIIKRFLYTFLFVFLSRIIFTLFNLDYFSQVSFIDFVLSLPTGIRFDLVTASIVIALPTIFSIIPLRNKLYEKFIQILYVGFNVLFLCTVILDSKYFYFSGKKLTIDLLMIGKDIQNQSIQLLMNFWFIGLLFIISSLLFIKFQPKLKHKYIKINIIKSTSLSFIILISLVIGIRGGLQMRSISPKNAFIFDKYELGNFVINSAYTLIRSIGAKGLERRKYLSVNEMNTYLPEMDFANTNPQKGKNIIIFLMESFSYEYFEKGYMPFLKSIAQKGASFELAYANGRRSIEVLPSIMASLPSIIGSPISQSQYQTNKFNSLPLALSKYGYNSYFFHGGKPGTMDFDSYARSIGFDDYFDLSNYPDRNDFDGNWGIFDHYFIEFMGNKIASMNKPFFATFFSLSSHQPYTIPKEFKNTFPKGTLAIHESIGYSDYALKFFFDKYQNENWFKNTLFIFTADHTQKLETKKYNNFLGRYRVPMIFYRPGETIKLNTNLIAQHTDIFPTIIDFIGEKEKIPLFGRSLYSNRHDKMLNFYSTNFIFHNSYGIMTFNDQIVKQYEISGDELKKIKSIDPELEKELKSYIQYGINGFINNNL